MEKAGKIFLVIFLFFAAFLIFASSANAKSYYVSTKATPSPTPVAQVNSFELFWPLAPGKTMTSKVYFLKTLKEDLRGMLIFGAVEKADYDVLLGTKRILEVQALADAGNLDLADKTLDKFNQKISEGLELYTKGKSEGEVTQSTVDNLKKQLQNLETFLKWYSLQAPDGLKSKLNDGLAKVQDFLKTL